MIQNLKSNLVGLPAIAALGIVERVDAVKSESKEPDIVREFGGVFHGLGTLGEEYNIKLKEGAVPYCLYTPTNVPIPLQEKVKEKLQRMEAMGVISKVDGPTQWCVGMVKEVGEGPYLCRLEST